MRYSLTCETLEKDINILVHESVYIPNRFQQKLISRQLIVALFSTQGLNLELNDIGSTIYGKPQMLNQNQFLYFNISHAKNMTVAVCDPRPIGIDIESKDRLSTDSTESLIDYIFESCEQSQICLNTHSLIQIWTIKEAVLKASGYGLWGGVKNVRISMSSVSSGRALFLGNIYDVSLCDCKGFDVAIAKQAQSQLMSRNADLTKS